MAWSCCTPLEGAPRLMKSYFRSTSAQVVPKSSSRCERGGLATGCTLSSRMYSWIRGECMGRHCSPVATRGKHLARVVLYAPSTHDNVDLGLGEFANELAMHYYS